jgi:hypothetical protein
MSVLLKEVSDYFKSLSALHKDVLDTPNNRAFCRYQDNTQFDELRNNAAKNIVVVMGFFARSNGSYDDQELKNTVIVRISSYSKTLKSADISRASEETSMGILLDFWTRMRKDFEDAIDICPWLRWVDWENIQVEEIEQPWLQNHYGWDWVVPFRTNLPAYNPDKWNS